MSRFTFDETFFILIMKIVFFEFQTFLELAEYEKNVSRQIHKHNAYRYCK